MITQDSILCLVVERASLFSAPELASHAHCSADLAECSSTAQQQRTRSQRRPGHVPTHPLTGGRIAPPFLSANPS
jgi:hypothetical protein